MGTEEQRPLNEVKTSGGHIAKIVQYITGGEMEDIDDSVAKAMQIDQSGRVTAATGSVLGARRNVQFEVCLKSLDGSTENLIERLRALPKEDYLEIRKAIEEVVDGKKTPAGSNVQ